MSFKKVVPKTFLVALMGVFFLTTWIFAFTSKLFTVSANVGLDASGKEASLANADACEAKGEIFFVSCGGFF